MKEFIKNKKITYNLMSFTGYKALVLFSLLSECPKSYEEICEYFENHPYLREKISIDTLRVYMNSLKRIGCEVKRFKGDDKISRYFITANPFELKLTDAQINTIKKVYKSLVKNIDIQELFAMENFFEKIGSYIKNDDFIADMRKISMLSDIDNDILKELINCCYKKEQIVITYNSPKSGNENIEIITDKIEISNGKIYLYGTGLQYMQYGSFLVNRIKKINEIKVCKTVNAYLEEIKVIYELQTDKPLLKDDEKLLSFDGTTAVIEVITSNKFFLNQRLLEYGPLCKIVEPDTYKNEFVQLLKDMKAGYYCG